MSAAAKVGAFAVGDRVTVCAHSGAPVGVRTVAAVAKSGKTFTDSRGIEWCNEDGGRLKGTKAERWYTGQSVYATKPEDADIVRRSVLIARVGATSWQGLSLDALAGIDALIRADAAVKS